MQIRVSQFSQLLHDLCQAIIAQDISTIAQHYFIVPKNAEHRRSGGFCNLCVCPPTSVLSFTDEPAVLQSAKMSNQL